MSARRPSTGFSFSPGRARGGPTPDARWHREAGPSGKWLPRPGAGQGSWGAGLSTAPAHSAFLAGTRVQGREQDTRRPVKVLFPIRWRADSAARRGRVRAAPRTARAHAPRNPNLHNYRRSASARGRETRAGVGVAAPTRLLPSSSGSLPLQSPG